MSQRCKFCGEEITQENGVWFHPTGVQSCDLVATPAEVTEGEPKIGYERRKCSRCGEGLGFSESDPCEQCSTEQSEVVARQALELEKASTQIAELNIEVERLRAKLEGKETK